MEHLKTIILKYDRLLKRSHFSPTGPNGIAQSKRIVALDF
jgi:hypothetical protein